MSRKSTRRWTRLARSISMAVLVLVAAYAPSPGGDLPDESLAADPWARAAKLIASDGAAGDNLGLSVATAGNTIVVGAWGNLSYRGAVYVFVEPEGGWADMTETAKLTASDASMLDGLGNSVAVSPDGETVVAGAYADDSAYKGSAYLFLKPEGGWVDMTETAKLTASDAASGDAFGWSVAISGDTVLVGSTQTGSLHGAAYVFVRPPGGWAGSPTENTRLTASDPAGLEDFGYSVSIDGDTAVVGVEERFDAKLNAAYLFVEPVGGWAGSLTETARLTASDGANGQGFGVSVAIRGDTAAVGAWKYWGSRGSAYLFAKPPGGWTAAVTQEQKISASDAAAEDYFGNSVAVGEG